MLHFPRTPYTPIYHPLIPTSHAGPNLRQTRLGLGKGHVILEPVDFMHWFQKRPHLGSNPSSVTCAETSWTSDFISPCLKFLISQMGIGTFHRGDVQVNKMMAQEQRLTYNKRSIHRNCRLHLTRLFKPSGWPTGLKACHLFLYGLHGRTLFTRLND